MVFAKILFGYKSNSSISKIFIKTVMAFCKLCCPLLLGYHACDIDKVKESQLDHVKLLFPSNTSVEQIGGAYLFHDKEGIFNSSSMSSIHFKRNMNKLEDANEFSVALLDKMADCHIANNIEKISQRSIRFTNIIGKIFKFCIKSTIHCNKSNCHQTLLTLCIEIKRRSLQSCVNKYLGSEILDDVEKYGCIKYKKKRKATKRLMAVQTY